MYNYEVTTASFTDCRCVARVQLSPVGVLLSRVRRFAPSPISCACLHGVDGGSGWWCVTYTHPDFRPTDNEPCTHGKRLAGEPWLAGG